ncbi:MAG: phosphoglycerate dehydrogenase [Bacillota bacterium]
MKKRVLITISKYNSRLNSIAERLEELGYSVSWKPAARYAESESIENGRGFHAIIAGIEPYSKAVLEELSGTLKVLSRFGVGYDNVDVEAATKLGIAVTTTPDSMSGGVADHALTMMLALGRRLVIHDANMKVGVWDPSQLGRELEGSTVGLVGFGKIGQCLAKYLMGFDCRLLVYDIAVPDDVLKRYNAIRSDLDTIARESDYVSLHVPLQESTRGLIDKSFLSKMKPTAFLINTSRGKVVNESDLVDALKAKIIAGAGLDVFEFEPLDNSSELLKMENVILTPHIASATIQSFQAAGQVAVTNVHDVLSGRIPKYILNPDYAGSHNVHFL